MTIPTPDSAAALGSDLLDHWARDGGPPSLPPGRRDEVVATLTRCVVNEPVRAAYLGALRAGRAAGRDRSPMAGFPAGDVPDDEILGGGFAALGDAALADIAVDPSAVRAVVGLLTWVPATPEQMKVPGDWFFDALDREEEGVPGPAPPPPIIVDRPAAPAVPSEPLALRRRRWLDYAPWSVAAAALVGLVVLWASNRDRGVGPAGREVLLAQAAPTAPEPRGADVVGFGLTVSAERDGFATVVVFPPGGPPRVYPGQGNDEKRVGPDARPLGVSFEAPPGSAALVVVTETPATDLVRRVLFSPPPGPVAPEAARDLIRERLFASGYRWAALGLTTVPPARP